MTGQKLLKQQHQQQQQQQQQQLKYFTFQYNGEYYENGQTTKSIFKNTKNYNEQF